MQFWFVLMGDWGDAAEGDIVFLYLLLCVTSRGTLVFCKDFYLDVFQKIQKMEGQWREQTDAGTVTQCCGKLSCMISCKCSPKALRIASRLTFSSQFAQQSYPSQGSPLHGAPFPGKIPSISRVGDIAYHILESLPCAAFSLKKKKKVTTWFLSHIYKRSLVFI